MHPNYSQQLRKVLEQAVASGAAPGLMAIVADREHVLFEGWAGLRELPEQTPMTPDSIFWIASLTKLVTAVAALQLVERGLLALDDPIDPLLPDLADYQVLTGFAEDGTPQLRAPLRRITLRHLLSHSSGLSSDLMDPILARARGAGGAELPFVRRSLRGPLRFDPGDGWTYGTGSDWAGLAIEAVTGQRLGDYFAAAIFAPLGMSDTDFAVPIERRAPLYARTGPNEFVPSASPVDDRSVWQYDPGGGGLFGSAGDYIRLLQTLLCDGMAAGGQILAPASVDLLFRAQTGSVRAGALDAGVPGMPAPFDLFPAMASGWSVGGMINPDDAEGRRRAGSLGWAGWANTYYWVDRSAGICAVLMAQFLPFADRAMIAALGDFERAAYAAEPLHM